MVPKKIAISVGEPAGIGPDILIQTVQKRRKDLLIALFLLPFRVGVEG